MDPNTTHRSSLSSYFLWLKPFLWTQLLMLNVIALISLDGSTPGVLPSLGTGFFGAVLHIGIGVYSLYRLMEISLGNYGQKPIPGRFGAMGFGAYFWAPLYVAVATLANGLSWNEYWPTVFLYQLVSLPIFAYLGLVALIAGVGSFIVASMMRH